MHFAYEFVPHAMDKIQEYIDYIFHHVWCAARTSGDYTLDLYSGHQELAELMKAWHYLDPAPKNVYFFTTHIEGIYQYFKTLDSGQIAQFEQWYRNNNDIEAACSCPSTSVARYCDLTSFGTELADLLQTFFSNLYDYISRGFLSKITGTTLQKHYSDFVNQNDKEICPFCGLGIIMGVHHSKRDAYDHYLPKSQYPFNTVNFHNLVPICNTCNSKYKLAKDPIYAADRSTRRKAFYPFSRNIPQINLSIALTLDDQGHIKPNNIDAAFDAPGYDDELATWRELYGIDERYKATCCSKSSGLYWLEEIRMGQNNGMSSEKYIETLTQLANRYPLNDKNFLKKAFLEACNNAGLFAEQVIQ